MPHYLEVEGEGAERGQHFNSITHTRLMELFLCLQDPRPRTFLIGCIGVSGKTKWDVLDGVVRRLFKVSGYQMP